MYSGSLSVSTAQSSMNGMGLALPLTPIIRPMPAFRTSHTLACSALSVILTYACPMPPLRSLRSISSSRALTSAEESPAVSTSRMESGSPSTKRVRRRYSSDELSC